MVVANFIHGYYSTMYYAGQLISYGIIQCINIASHSIHHARHALVAVPLRYRYNGPVLGIIWYVRYIISI
jgi:hypothetical protein